MPFSVAPNIVVVSWQKAQIFAVPTENDPEVELIIAQYLRDLKKQGYNPNLQGIWLQSEWAELANVHANVPISAASLTKIATSLAAIEKLGLQHRFITTIQQTGEVTAGVLKGNLVIVGDRDPLLTWEEGIALANSLERLGIKKIEGDLLIVDNFYMNFQTDPQKSGEALKRSFNWRLWPSSLVRKYAELPSKNSKPALIVQGQVKVIPNIPANSRLILRHKSLALLDIIKQMNVYSNNHIAQMLADSVGGVGTVVQVAQQMANISPEEIQLVNGSGLGVNNRISPHAVCQIWLALEKRLATESLKISDIFPVSGIDTQGTLRLRHLPLGIPVKTGTLDEVSAIAGVVSTQERGSVWFAIINHGERIDKLRQQQDLLLERLSHHWQFTHIHPNSKPVQPFLGDPSRNSF